MKIFLRLDLEIKIEKINMKLRPRDRTLNPRSTAPPPCGFSQIAPEVLGISL